jgi:hypothetical protein
VNLVADNMNMVITGSKGRGEIISENKKVAGNAADLGL